MRIRSGDHVKVISGKDRGKTGRVLRVDPGKARVYVEGLNMAKRHVRPRQPSRSTGVPGTERQLGGVIEKPSPLHVGNVMVVCPVCNRPTRVGIRDKDSHGQPVKVRICKRADCGEDIDR